MYLIAENELNKIANQIQGKLLEIRKKIHEHPELAMETYNTSNVISNYLTNLGIESHTVLNGAGVVGIIEGERSIDTTKGKSNAKTIALRADIDALPVIEENIFEYKSCVPGVMHACGHDFHMACLLGAAEILNTFKSKFRGNIKLLFQPAEEIIEGASAMIKAGVLENPPVDACLASHVWPGIPVGKIGIIHGPSFAAINNFIITIKGKGGHGAMPHETIDPIVIGATITNALQTIISRGVNTFEPAILSVCSFNSGSSINITPDIAVLKGTLRAFDINLRKKLENSLCDISHGIAKTMGAEVEIEFLQDAPPVINDNALTDLLVNSATKIIGTHQILTDLKPPMVSEDFAFFSERIPSTHFLLGCRSEEKGFTYPLHNSRFNGDEDCIGVGSSLFAQFAIDYLSI